MNDEFDCLEFANTLTVSRGEITDIIDTFAKLTQWLLEQNLVPSGVLTELKQQWSAREENRLVELAQQFRDAIRVMAEHLTQRKPLPESVLEMINDLLAHQSGYASVVKKRTGFEMQKHRDLDQPEHLLVPLAESAAKLLCEADPSLVKKCDNPECILFFYDSTRNHRRRWCSMQTCGNRMKVDAYWKRKRKV